MNRIDCKKCKHHCIVYRCEDNCELENNGHRCRFEELVKETNGDRIRKMSNEELVTFMRGAAGCPTNDTKCNEKECDDCWLEWLNKEV